MEGLDSQAGGECATWRRSQLPYAGVDLTDAYTSWLFVINAIMTVVVGSVGFFMLPDYPNRPNPRAFWFTSDHAKMANERLERHGRAEAKRISWASAKSVQASFFFPTFLDRALPTLSCYKRRCADLLSRRTFSMWVAYFIPVLYISTVLAQWGYNYFNLFLKSLKNPDGTPTWSVAQVNAIPIAGSAINVFFGKRLRARNTITHPKSPNLCCCNLPLASLGLGHPIRSSPNTLAASGLSGYVLYITPIPFPNSEGPNTARLW